MPDTSREVEHGGTPCFSDRFNLLLKLIVTPPDPVTGQRRPYRIAELSDALPLSEEGRRLSETRLRQIAKNKDSNPTLSAVRQIASGFATLAARDTPQDMSPDALRRMYYRYLAGEADETTPPADRAREVDRLHEQFTAQLDRRTEESQAVSVLGRFLDLESPESRDQVLRSLDAALRGEGRRGLWPRRRDRGK